MTATIIAFPQQPAARPAYWLPMELAPLDGRLVAVLVPMGEGGFIQGRAYFDAKAYDGTWWWEGTSMDDYGCDPIEECNHGNPVAFRLIDAL